MVRAGSLSLIMPATPTTFLAALLTVATAQSLAGQSLPPWEPPVPLVHRVILDHRAPQVQQDLPERPDLQEPLEQPAPRVRPDRRVPLVRRASKVQPDLRGQQ